MPPHIIAIRAKKATLNKRVTGCARMLSPARTVRAIGARMTMNAVGKSHKRPNKTIWSKAFRLFTVLNLNSRIANGSTRIKLMSAADPRVVMMLFVVCFIMDGFLNR